MAVRLLRFPVRQHSRGWVGAALAVVVVVTGAVGTLHAADSRLSLRLSPGRYAFAFVVSPPWEVLLPDFGRKRNGAFHVHTVQTTTLGVVQPAAEWITIGE